jgi:hypothetical protein
VINTMDLSADALLLIRLGSVGSRGEEVIMYSTCIDYGMRKNCINKSGKIVLENNVPFEGLQKPRIVCN